LVAHTGEFRGLFLLELRQGFSLAQSGRNFSSSTPTNSSRFHRVISPSLKAGAAHRAPNSVGTASKAVVSVPQLVFLTPAGLFQSIGAEYQHLTGVILLGTVTNAVLRPKQSQLLKRFPIEIYKAIQNGGVASDSDLGVVPLILRNDSTAPPTACWSD
jgi:hypothetical protein